MKKRVNTRKTDSFFSFFLDILCIFLLSTGFVILINSMFYHGITVPEVFLRTSVITLALTLITRNKWVGISAVIIALGTLFTIWVTGDGLDKNIATLKGFVGWWSSNMPNKSDYNTSYFRSLLFWIIALFIVSAVFFAVRVIKNSLPLLIISIATVPLLFFVGDRSENLLAAVTVLLGVLPLFARDTFFGKRFFRKKEKYTSKTPHALFSAVALGVCIALAAGVCLLLPDDTLDWRTRSLSDAVVDIQLKYNIVPASQRNIGVTLHEMGLQEDKKRIGGKIGNDSKKVIAKVTSDKRQLLKVTSFDTFTGWTWQNDADYDYLRYDDEKNADAVRTAFSGTGFDEDNYLSMLDKFLDYEDITVEYTKRSNSILSTAQMVNFSEEVYSNNPLLFDNRGELYSVFKEKKGYKYYFSTHRFPSIDGKRNNSLKFVNFIAMTKLCKDKQYDDKNFYDLYTKTPKYWSQNLEKLAADIYDISGGQFYAAESICRYFGKNNGYSYSNNPKRADKKKITAIDELYVTKNGSCVQYATAMCMMTRSVGIPSRICIGYKADKTDSDGKRLIRECDTYAWVECYFRGVGWVTFDPYPRYYDETITGIRREPEKEDSNKKDVKPEPEEIIIEEIEEEDTPISPVPFIILGIVILLAVIVLIIRAAVSEKKYLPSYIRKHIKGNSARAEYCYRDMKHQLKGFRINIGNGNTVRELFEMSPDDVKTEDMAIAVTAIEALHYGKKEPTDDELTAIFNTRYKLESALYINENSLKYYFTRKMFLSTSKRGIYKYSNKRQEYSKIQ